MKKRPRDHEIRPMPYGRYFAAFIMATVIFSSFFVYSYLITYSGYLNVNQDIGIIDQYLKDLEELSLIEECTDNLLVEASVRLDAIGSLLGLLEKRFGKDDPRVIEEKRKYSDLMVKHFEIISYLNENCGKDFLTILFFYSNEEELSEASETQGYIISTFKNQNRDKIMVYAFDANINSDSISRLKDRYGAYSYPITVVNEQDRISVWNIDDLEVYL